MRVLITGSRDWDDRSILAQVLLNAEMTAIPEHGRLAKMLLVSGACPTGADRIAEEYAEEWGWKIERHPADWDQYGKRAGFLRNSEMVHLGADVCLAFIKNESRGASMTARLAEEAGIPTVRTIR